MEVQAQFFRTTIGIKSVPNTTDKSRFVMIFLTISFRLVLQRKTGKQIPESLRLEFLEKF